MNEIADNKTHRSLKQFNQLSRGVKSTTGIFFVRYINLEHVEHVPFGCWKAIKLTSTTKIIV